MSKGSLGGGNYGDNLRVNFGLRQEESSFNGSGASDPVATGPPAGPHGPGRSAAAGFPRTGFLFDRWKWLNRIGTAVPAGQIIAGP